MRIKIGFILLLMGYCGIAQAQNTTSPFSVYGIGTIQTSGFNRTTGLGSSGIAYRSENNIIQNNPASYTDLTQQMFHIEFSARAQVSGYSGAVFSNNASTPTGTTGNSQVSNDITISRIAFGTKVTKWWGSSMGLLPYSKVAYQFSQTETIGNGEPVSVTYSGTGGLNKAYWGNGFSLGKHVSLGFTGSFLFGPLQTKEVMVAPTAAATVTSDRNLYLRNVNVDFGGQYYTQFGRNKEWGLTLGGTFSPEQHLNAEDSLQVSTGPTNVINTALLDRNRLPIPQSYGGGFAISRSAPMQKVTLLGEFQRSLWTPLGYKGDGYTLDNSSRYSGGIEISKQKNIFNTPVEHVYYQFGGYYSKTYLTLNGSPVQEWGGTFGIGVNPMRYPQWGYHLGFELGETSNYQNSSLRETYFRLNLTIHYWDRWFTKGRRVL